MKYRIVYLAAQLAIFGLPGVAQAAQKAWVSGSGQDVPGCGQIGVAPGPCRNFQYAHDTMSSGGEILVHDPAGYGPLNITKSISITNEGGVAFSPSITVNAGALDTVTIRGITLDGFLTGATGLQITNALAVNLSNVTIQNFTTTGIQLAPTSPSQYPTALKLFDSRIVNINGPAISINLTSGPAQADLDHVTITSTHDGIVANAGNLPLPVNLGINVSNSKITGLGGNGVSLTSGGTFALAFINNTTMSFIAGTGVLINGPNANAAVSRSYILGCITGLSNTGGTLNSGGDNQIACQTPSVGTIGQVQYH
jgi:hypothetical protein